MMGIAGEANALPLQYVDILLDGSGSMLDTAFQQTVPGMPPQPVKTKWKEAIERASQRVLGQRDDKDQMPVTDANWFINEEDDLNTPPTTDSFYPPAVHCYQIHIFAGSTVTKVYPDASSGLVYQCGGDTITKNKAVYDTVRTFLNNLAPPASPGLMTPLTDGLCKVLDQSYFHAGFGENKRSIILESDGMENNSSDPAWVSCRGTTTGTFNPNLRAATGSPFLKWGGGLPKESWMYKIYNKAFNNDPAYYPDPALPPPWENKTVLGIRAEPSTQRNFTFFINEANNWNDINFAKSQARAAIMHVDALYDFVQPGATGAEVAARNAAAFPTALKDFFKGLSVHSRGRFQKIQYNANNLPGAAHNPPGDVDDSGCVTTADVNHIRQTDTWLRPSNATPHTKLCDANRDGWINQLDINVAMARMNTCRPGCTLATQTSCVPK